MTQRPGPRELALRDMRARKIESLALPKKKRVAAAIAASGKIVPKPKEPNLKTETASPPDPTAVRGSDPSPELAAMAAKAIGHAPENAPKPKASAKANTKESAVSKTAKKPAAAKAPAKSKSKPKTKSAARRAPAKPKTAARSSARPVKSGDGESKTAIVGGLLQRPEGCTTADVLEATGWPSVSLPQMAKATGLKLKKEKDGKVTRYRGTPA